MAPANSDEAWRRWGESDPYYGVLAADRFRTESIDDHREEFWRLGELQVLDRIDAAERHFGPVARGRALDFGCGVARLSMPLARRFAQVVSLDISPAMLAEARKNAADAGLGNIRFALSDDGLREAAGRYDFVMSFIVFQHIPVARGMQIMRTLLDRVAAGGVVALDVCIDRGDTRMQALRYWLQRHVPGAHALFNRARGRPAAEPLMQMNAYSVDAIQQLAGTLGFGPAIVETVPHGRFTNAQLLMQRETVPAS